MSSYEGGVSPISRIAGADFSAALYHVAKVNSNGEAVLTAAATDTPIGIVGMNAASGEVVPINPLVGRLKVKAGGSISAGNLLVPNDSGEVTGVAGIANITADAMAIGIALNDGDSGDVIDFWAQPMTATSSA